MNTNTATYSPEDNKLRLYVGRVPRPEYEALRAEGWTSTPKQNCDFVATWTPARRDRALSYAEIIEDEDMGPAERAADRAERFAGYLGKRLDEATGHADRFDAGPAVHGFQSQARAERSAARHDRIGTRAVDAWDKAEYWQRRTAGVISNALHLSSPSVRMGRVKELELAIARHEKNERDDAWTNHYRLRLAYENQMLEACGGRAAVVEMVVGGFWKGQRIHGINKSPVTGNVVSLDVWGKYTSWRRGNLVQFEGVYLENIERDGEGHYRAPTPEELAEFEAAQKAAKKAKREAKKDAPPEPKLINPTDADAERLQALWNLKKYHYSSEPQTVLRLTQAEASAALKAGSVSTKEIVGGGFRLKGNHDAAELPVVAKVRSSNARVVVITDKPQTAFPDFVWYDTRPDIQKELENHVEALEAAACASWSNSLDEDTQGIVFRARQVGLFYVMSMSQFGFTEAGRAWVKKVKEARAAAVVVAPADVEPAGEVFKLEY
ncbi:MAG: DUF3560 domain-containing protein [Rariglobus sp.]